MSEKKIEELLKLSSMNNGDMSKLTANQRKEMKEYKFWKTQPVTKFDEEVKEEGPIHEEKTPADIPDEPSPSLPDFEWCAIDVDDEKQLEDVFVSSNENYVEDRDASFRFNYTREFFNWALKSPGWTPDWHIGVRVKASKKSIAFISAIPVRLRVRAKVIDSVEINFLCVHKQSRSKRLTPVSIKEITRRVNKRNIWHASYTAGVVLPAPVSTCRYAHRPLNWDKLYEVQFTDSPPNATKAEMVAKYTLPKATKTAGSRELRLEDVDQASASFNRYQSRFDIVQEFTKEEFIHWFINDKNVVEQDKRVVFSYVVESEGKVTDFFSFYSSPFTILNNSRYKDSGIGYLYYYASDADFKFEDRFDKEGTSLLKQRLSTLVQDACIIAAQNKMDVFNALSSQDNTSFSEDSKFGPGDGFLNFYSFNYRTFPITGGSTEDQHFDTEHRSNVGVVMS